MSTMIQLRNVPDDLHRRLKARAATAGMSLSDYLLKEIAKIAERPTMEEMRERLATRSRGGAWRVGRRCGSGDTRPIAIMIVADASALFDVLRRRSTAASIEARLLGSGVTLHAPHLLDVEMAQVVRRHAAAGEIVPIGGMSC